MKKAVIFDLDNVVLRTSVRKRKILSDRYNIQLSIDEIECDYELTSVFKGDEGKYSGFFNFLNTERAILENPAPLFDGVIETFSTLKRVGCENIILTGRGEKLRVATNRELRNLGLTSYHYILLYMLRDSEISEKGLEDQKKAVIAEIKKYYDVIAHIGDRTSDIKASLFNDVIPIYFNTVPSSHVLMDSENYRVCNDWKAIKRTLANIMINLDDLDKLREDMTDRYSSYLSDIDSKAKANISVAGIIVALAGGLIFRLERDGFDMNGLGKTILALIFFSSVVSLIFSIKSLTARSTSGEKAGQEISSGLIKKIGYGLVELFKKQSLLKHKFLDKDDPIIIYKDFKGLDEDEKRDFHLSYFSRKYKSLDKDVLINANLFAMMAANYEKAHSEKNASALLVLSITLIIALVFLRLFGLV